MTDNDENCNSQIPPEDQEPTPTADRLRSDLASVEDLVAGWESMEMDEESMIDNLRANLQVNRALQSTYAQQKNITSRDRKALSQLLLKRGKKLKDEIERRVALQKAQPQADGNAKIEELVARIEPLEERQKQAQDAMKITDEDDQEPSYEMYGQRQDKFLAVDPGKSFREILEKLHECDVVLASAVDDWENIMHSHFLDHSQEIDPERRIDWIGYWHSYRVFFYIASFFFDVKRRDIYQFFARHFTFHGSSKSSTQVQNGLKRLPGPGPSKEQASKVETVMKEIRSKLRKIQSADKPIQRITHD